MSTSEEHPGLTFKFGRWWRQVVPRVCYCLDCWHSVTIHSRPFQRDPLTLAQGRELLAELNPHCKHLRVARVTRKGRGRRPKGVHE